MFVFEAVLIMAIFLFCLFAGIPVAFSILIPAIVTMLLGGIELKVVPQMFVSGVQNFTLLAIPFFLLAGNIMNTSGITQRIFNICLAIIGHVKGGLAHVNVLASMVFGGISGSALADAAGLGKIEIDAMKKTGYDKNFSAAITAASSIIGAIIPPSIIMVVYAAEAKVSVGAMFKAGLVPGILVGLCLMVGIVILIARGEKVPEPTKRSSIKDILIAFKDGFFALIAPVIILTGMFSGIFTPTEAGVVAVVYSIIVGLIYRELKINELYGIFKESATDVAQVMFMTSAAALLSWVVTYVKIPVLISEVLFSITDSKIVFLILVNLFMLFLGCFIESIAGMLIILPILLPIALELGIDPIHFGMVICFGMLIGATTPPFGTALFVVTSVAEASFERVSLKILPFVVMLIVALLLVTFIPQISLWLPSILR